MAASRKKPSDAGLFDIEVVETGFTKAGLNPIDGDLEYLEPVEYEKERQPLYLIEAISKNPLRRLRWTAAPDLENTPRVKEVFFKMLQSIACDAVSVPFNEGVEWAFLNQLPASCRFSDMAEADRYMAEEIRKARFKQLIPA